jgi:hypothetical protein
LWVNNGTTRLVGVLNFFFENLNQKDHTQDEVQKNNTQSYRL